MPIKVPWKLHTGHPQRDSCSGRAVILLPPHRREGAIMTREIVKSAKAPSSPLFSQGVRGGPFVFVSGMAGIDPSNGHLAGDNIQAQTRQALENCEGVLQAAGADMDDVVEVGVLLTRPADFPGLNEEYARWFPIDPPARYVARLGVDLPGLLVSIRMTAFIS
jgi:enamine deaminase RidA (YjgF/YER057c/UK114 family)